MMQKGQILIWIIVGAMVIAVAGGAYYLGKSSSPKPSPTPDVTSQTPQPTSSPSPSDETANWKTYISIKANYSFKYPEEWPLVNVPESPQCTACIETIVFSPAYNPNSGDTNTAIIQVFKEDDIKTLDDYINVHYKGDQSKINLQNSTIGGEKAISYKLSGGIPPLPVIEYAVVKNGFYYIIRLDDSVETNKNIEIFNQILSTFKFL